MMQVSKTMIAVLSSLAIASGVSGQTLSVEQTVDTIVVRQDGREVLTYIKRSPQVPAGIDLVYRRSGCLHPVRSPQGRAVTEMFPFDHPHVGKYRFLVPDTMPDPKLIQQQWAEWCAPQ